MSLNVFLKNYGIIFHCITQWELYFLLISFTLVSANIIYLFIHSFIYVFLGLHPQHMEVPRLGVTLEP